LIGYTPLHSEVRRQRLGSDQRRGEGA